MLAKMRNARIPAVRWPSGRLFPQASCNAPERTARYCNYPRFKLMPPIAKVAHRQADSALSGFREQVDMPIPSHLAATSKCQPGGSIIHASIIRSHLDDMFCLWQHQQYALRTRISNRGSDKRSIGKRQNPSPASRRINAYQPPRKTASSQAEPLTASVAK